MKRPPPSDLAIFFSFPSTVVPGVWPVFRYIFSTRDLRRNLCIRWRIRTPFYDIILTYICPFFQINIYWVLRGQIFLSHITSPKKFFFSKPGVASDSARRDLFKYPIKIWVWCKSALDLILSLRSVPCNQVQYTKTATWDVIYETSLFNISVTSINWVTNELVQANKYICIGMCICSFVFLRAIRL